MSEDMPWVIGLTDEEIQELRTKKHELTEYGKQKIKQLMMNQEPYPDAMFEEAERREKENEQFLNSLQGTMTTIDPYSVKKEAIDEYLKDQKEKKVLEIAKNFIEEHSDAMKQLAKIEHQELARELALKLREWSQNEEMIDQYFTAHGEVCNQAANLLELFAKYQDSE